MRRAINEGGGHILSFLGTMIDESSLDTVGLRTFGRGSRVLNLADQKNPKCVEGEGALLIQE